jgi:hypothetical protein
VGTVVLPRGGTVDLLSIEVGGYEQARASLWHVSNPAASTPATTTATRTTEVMISPFP